MDFFDLKTKIYMGGSGLSAALSQAKRVLVVTDRFMAESGKTAYVTGRLPAQCQWEIYGEIGPDPDVDMITAGVSKVLEFQPDFVVALGGGSPIDAAKAMIYFATNQGATKPGFVAIPTTSGTGSEVTKFAVITDREKGVKYPLVTSELLPDVAILDAELTQTVPPHITADTGLDVFTHAIEAFVCTEANTFTDAVAEKSVKLVYENLLTAYHTPGDLEARQNMHNASCLAGIAFSNSGLGLCHAMAHQLGAIAHVPHGRANAMLLPHIMRFNAGCHNQKLTHVAKKYAHLSAEMGLGASNTRQSALNLIRTVERYLRDMKIPKNLGKAGVDVKMVENALPQMVEAALQDACMATTPIPPTAYDIEMIYRQILV